MNADGRFFLDVDRQNLWTGIGINAKWNIADGIYLTKAANLNKVLLEAIRLIMIFLRHSATIMLMNS